MPRLARERVPILTAVLSIASLALVFAAVGGVVPRAAIPRAPDPFLDAIPHVNALVSGLAILTIVAGVRAIRRNRVQRHRRAMTVALGLFATFLLLYLYRVAVYGPSSFDGPDAVYTAVYLPLLAIHMLLAVVCIPLLYYVLLLALSTPVRNLGETPHPRVGRVAAVLWVTSFALGIGVYLLLYWVF